MSVLSGKVMFRDVYFITKDYSLRIQLGLAIFRWWRPLTLKKINEGQSVHLLVIESELFVAFYDCHYSVICHNQSVSIQLVFEYGRRHLCSSSYRTLAVPQTHTTVTGRMWNNLLATLRHITSYGKFN